MTVQKEQPACAAKRYVVRNKDLPLSCPTDKMVLWNAHPKVYLAFDANGVAVCPYCSAHYKLKSA
jgi:uncharacterized Zn-finger protein